MKEETDIFRNIVWYCVMWQWN